MTLGTRGVLFSRFHCNKLVYLCGAEKYTRHDQHEGAKEKLHLMMVLLLVPSLHVLVGLLGKFLRFLE